MNKKRYIYQIINPKIAVFLLCFIPKIIINLYVKTTPGGHDDLGMMIVPSILAGLDWSGLIQETSYYGFGYSILYTPILFLLKNNSYLMFQAIFMLNAFFQALMGVLIYSLLVEHYKVCNSYQAITISATMSFLSFTASCKVANDVILPLVTWTLVWIITLLIECNESKKRNKLTVILIIVLSYSVTLHSRSIIYWLGIIISVVLFRVKEKRWIINPKIFLTVGSAFMGGASILVSLIQKNIWVQTTNLTNSSSVIGVMLKLGVKSLFEENSIRAIISLIGGNLFAITQYTYGYFLLGMVFLFLLIWRVFAKNSNESLSVEQKAILWGNVFSFICFSLMFMGLCVSYVFQAVPAFENSSSFSGFFYIRYYYNFATPIILLGILNGMRIIRYRNTYSLIALAVFLFTLCYAIVAFLMGKLPLRDYWTSFGAKINGNDKTILDVSSYMIIYLVTVAIMIGLFFCSKYISRISLLLLVIISLYSYAYQNINSAKIWADNYYEKTNTFEQKILRQYEIDNDEYYICVPDKNSAYGLQLRQVEYTIHMELPEENQKVLCLLGKKSSEMLDRGFKEICLSNDEYLYINDIETYEKIRGDNQNDS